MPLAETATQARGTGRKFYSLVVDEAPRYLDHPTDIGDALARCRKYGVGLTIVTQLLELLPEAVREAARTKVAFQSSARYASNGSRPSYLSATAP